MKLQNTILKENIWKKPKMYRMTMILLHRITQIVFSFYFVPGLLFLLWQIGAIAFGTLKIGLLLCGVVFVVLPLIFKHSITVQRNVLFLTFVNHSSASQLQKPELSGLYASRNFYLKHNDNELKRVSLGCWHILPNQLAELFSDELQIDKETTNLSSQNKIEVPFGVRSSLSIRYSEINHYNKDKFFEELLTATKHPIVLYLHGNAYDRSASHRVELYNVLRSINVHVIAFDYRSYGDSSPVAPNENGVVSDALFIYSYLVKLTKSPIFIWGHSLGTGVGCHLASILQNSTLPKPKGVILESPFNNIGDEVKYHPLSTPFRRLPWFNYMFVEPMRQNEFRFESDIHVGEFKAPLLILHAEDDLIVPFSLGHKLYRKAEEIRDKSWGPVSFHRFAFSHGFGHKFICRADNLPEMIQNFIVKFKNESF